VSVFDEAALRELIAEEVRRAVREEVGRAPREDVFLSVARAAEVADVAPATIRKWIHEGRLPQHGAGRELRVRRTELEEFLAAPRASDADATPEQAAVRYLRRRKSG